MQTLQQWLVLIGVLLNLSAFVYSIYVRSVLYATVFLLVSGYLVIVYRTKAPQSS